MRPPRTDVDRPPLQRIDAIDDDLRDRGTTVALTTCSHWLIGWIASAHPDVVHEAIDEYLRVQR